MAAGAAYEEFPFPESRTAVVDFVEEGRRKNHIAALIELDVTEALELNRTLKEAEGRGLSFTGWLAKCVAQSVAEHRSVHALRKGRRRLVVFDDVDVSILVEEPLEGAGGPTRKFPMPYVMRSVDKKSVREITDEVSAAQGRPVRDSEVFARSRMSAWQRLFFALPFPLRRLLYSRRYVKDPFFAKERMGTVALTSVGMFGRGLSGSAWGIPIGVHPLIVLVGGIARKPVVVGGAIAARDMLSLTVLFDHEVVDGAPAARFLSRLRELVEGGYALREEVGAARERVGAPAPGPVRERLL